MSEYTPSVVDDATQLSLMAENTPSNDETKMYMRVYWEKLIDIELLLRMLPGTIKNADVTN